jgi:hypothetical protein
MSWHWYVDAFLLGFTTWTWRFAARHRAAEVAILMVERDALRRRLTELGGDLAARPGTQETLRRAFERLILAGLRLDDVMRELLKGREDLS